MKALNTIRMITRPVISKVKDIAGKIRALNTKLQILLYAVVIAAFPLIISNSYIMHILILLGVYLMLGISLNTVTGLAGELDLGHAAFYGIGAYASSLFATRVFDSFWAGFLIAIFVSFLFGILLGIPSLRIRGDYLAIVTMGFNEIIRYVLINWTDLTNGALGVSKITPVSFAGITLSSKQLIFYLMAVMVMITYIVMNRINVTKFGRALVAVRENEIAAASLGINTGYYKIFSFAISAAFAGAAGSFYAHYMSFINPSNFTTNDSILILCMVVIGGKGSMLGTIIGVSILFLLPECLRALETYRMLIYGILLIAMMIFRPKGFCPEKRVPARQ